MHRLIQALIDAGGLLTIAVVASALMVLLIMVAVRAYVRAGDE